MNETENGFQHLFTDRRGGLILSDWVAHGLEFIAVALIVLAAAVLIILLLFIIDVNQHRNAIRRNYPVLGRFRYLFIRAGEFFRQYFFAMDREEMPFNRAEREWVNRAANNTANTIPFGSTNNLEVALIAHACGVREPRALRRAHVRIVGGEIRSRPMDEIKPLPNIWHRIKNSGLRFRKTVLLAIHIK